jgi:hypothetical protein
MEPRAIRGLPRGAYSAGLLSSADRGILRPSWRVHGGSGETGRRDGKRQIGWITFHMSQLWFTAPGP